MTVLVENEELRELLEAAKFAASTLPEGYMRTRLVEALRPFEVEPVSYLEYLTGPNGPRGQKRVAR